MQEFIGDFRGIEPLNRRDLPPYPALLRASAVRSAEPPNGRDSRGFVEFSIEFLHN